MWTLYWVCGLVDRSLKIRFIQPCRMCTALRGVQPGDVGAQLADLGDQGLGLSHGTSISALTPMSTSPGSAEATAEGKTDAAVTGQGTGQGVHWRDRTAPSATVDSRQHGDRIPRRSCATP